MQGVRGVRFFDLILAIAVLAALLFIARHQFPSYQGKVFAPVNAQAESTSSPTPRPMP
jgi:hypothetical protein